MPKHGSTQRTAAPSSAGQMILWWFCDDSVMLAEWGAGKKRSPPGWRGRSLTLVRGIFKRCLFASFSKLKASASWRKSGHEYSLPCSVNSLSRGIKTSSTPAASSYVFIQHHNISRGISSYFSSSTAWRCTGRTEPHIPQSTTWKLLCVGLFKAAPAMAWMHGALWRALEL